MRSSRLATLADNPVIRRAAPWRRSWAHLVLFVLLFPAWVGALVALWTVIGRAVTLASNEEIVQVILFWYYSTALCALAVPPFFHYFAYDARRKGMLQDLYLTRQTPGGMALGSIFWGLVAAGGMIAVWVGFQTWILIEGQATAEFRRVAESGQIGFMRFGIREELHVRYYGLPHSDFAIPFASLQYLGLRMEVPLLVLTVFAGAMLLSLLAANWLRFRSFWNAWLATLFAWGFAVVAVVQLLHHMPVVTNASWSRIGHVHRQMVEMLMFNAWWHSAVVLFALALGLRLGIPAVTKRAGVHYFWSLDPDLFGREDWRAREWQAAHGLSRAKRRAMLAPLRPAIRAERVRQFLAALAGAMVGWAWLSIAVGAYGLTEFFRFAPLTLSVAGITSVLAVTGRDLFIHGERPYPVVSGRLAASVHAWERPAMVASLLLLVLFVNFVLDPTYVYSHDAPQYGLLPRIISPAALAMMVLPAIAMAVLLHLTWLYLHPVKGRSRRWWLLTCLLAGLGGVAALMGSTAMLYAFARGYWLGLVVLVPLLALGITGRLYQRIHLAQTRDVEPGELAGGDEHRTHEGAD